ncbi:hypothetical protein RJ639_040238 [Escallonia herrerae]|uniref:Pentatricopeptide repeat-containing protein n=1 Tax=Escallonia herrerae TaxID=1293975 RepID=A0AA89B5Z5_9ASTE|nr:hypothetical protein RJ639_040238 [Escallonia herrerae]
MDEKKDLVSWSAMISCFTHNGMESQSIAMFADMLRFGECPNEFCFTTVIQACCRPDYARTGMILFGFVMKTGYFESDLWFGCALIHLFAKRRGNMGYAKKMCISSLSVLLTAVDFFMREHCILFGEVSHVLWGSIVE